jgi:hypothetical protein
LLNHLFNKTLGVLLLLSLIIFSCEKDSQLNDSPLNPGGELTLMVSDTLPLVAYTTQENFLDGKNQAVTPLGRITDTRFGEMSASFYANFRLSVIGFDPEGTVTLDSSFLSLTFNKKYGPNTQPLNIEIYELDEALVSANDYRNNTTLATKPTLIGSLTNYTFSADSGVIKIPLTNAFAQTLINQFGQSTLISNDNFQNFFKGVHVKTTGVNDGLVHLQLTSSALNLFFNATSSTDSIYSFFIDNQSTRVNKFIKNFSGSEVEVLLNDPSNNDEVLYVSAFSGTRAFFEMPDFSFLANTIINRAEISFYEVDIDNPLATSFPAPDNLFLFLNIADSTSQLLPGVTTNNIGSFGGFKTPKTVNGIATNEYKFNITTYVQSLVNENITNKSVALSVLNVNSGNRLKVGGGNHPDLPIKLKIVYTLAQ